MAVLRHLLRKVSSLGCSFLLLCFLWVDDLILARNVAPHGFCGGLSSGCDKCAAALADFERIRRYWHDLAEVLGISLSLSKRQQPSQRIEYTGVIVDTIAGRLFIPGKKLEKLRKCLIDLMAASDCSTRDILSARGRVRHYSLCINHILPLVPLLSAEGEDPNRLDARLPLTSAVKESAELILRHVDRFAAAGAALWQPVASSLYGAFLRGDTGCLVWAVITWDSARSGVGCLIRNGDNPDGRLVVSTFGHGDIYEAQVHIEAVGGCIALEAASRVIDLRGATVIFRNDATGALAAFRKGSSSSDILQAQAVRMTKLCAELEINALFLHAPGRDLVDEGVDDASRRLASAIAGPACSASLRSLVHNAAAAQGWTISVDLFASAGNCLVDRYYSEYPEPSAEAVDAIAVTDWDTSACPHCRRTHRETIFAYPPRVLLSRFVRKARADGARGIVIVPFAITASYWPRLMEAARPIDGKPFVHIRSPEKMLVETQDLSSPALAIFAIDFGPSSSRRSDSIAPACGQEVAWRGRPLLGHPGDVTDRKRIRSALARHLLDVDVGVASPALHPL